MNKEPTLDFEAWLALAVERLQQALDHYQIGQTQGPLWQSIAGEIIRTGEDVAQILIKFAQYGRFVDMGVGRGMPRGGRRKLGEEQFLKQRNRSGQLHRYNRSPKPWFSKTKTREVARLRQLLAEHYEHKLINQIEQGLEKIQ